MTVVYTRCQMLSSPVVEEVSRVSVNGVAALMKRANAIYEKYGENASGLMLKDRTDAW